MKAHMLLGGNRPKVSSKHLAGLPYQEFSSRKLRNRLLRSYFKFHQIASSFFYKERCSFEREIDMMS